MAKLDDYQLEEMENSAVEKSTMAKRAVVGVGLLAAGAATAYGANKMMDGNETPKENANQDGLMAGAKAGAVEIEETQVEETEVVSAQPETVNVHHYVHQVQPEPDPEASFDTSVHVYDEDGNLVGSIDEGTYDGKAFQVVDVDGDGHGDYLLYDENGDGKFTENEVSKINVDYAMGKGRMHKDLDTDGNELHNIHFVGKDDIADIKNDFYDEKAGEEYGHDLADVAKQFGDYDNRADVGQYSANAQQPQYEDVSEPDGQNIENDDVTIEPDNGEIMTEGMPNPDYEPYIEPSIGEEYVDDGLADIESSDIHMDGIDDDYDLKSEEYIAQEATETVSDEVEDGNSYNVAQEENSYDVAQEDNVTSDFCSSSDIDDTSNYDLV